MYEFLDWRVEDVMSRPLTISQETTLADAQALIEEKGFNALPVVDASQKLVGLVSSLDLIRAFCFPEDVILPPYDRIMRKPVSEVMSRDILVVQPRTPLTRLLQKIVDTRNKSFPVVDGDHVVGIVAREDVMHALRKADAGRKP